jgi:hypothetical protein
MIIAKENKIPVAALLSSALEPRVESFLPSGTIN